MKQCYTKLPFILAFTLLAYLPTHLSAQCLCQDGSAPQVLTYQQTRIIRPIDDSTTFDLLQFNPDMGQLTCVEVFSYITGVVRMRLENDEIYAVSYRIGYTRTDQITGPGLGSGLTNNFSKNYGPYSLAASDGAYFSGPDFVAIGPDSVLRNRYLNRNISNIAPFLGYGNLQYSYKVTGRTTVTGSINYIFSVSSQDIVTVGVNYRYCPTDLLSGNMRDFAAYRKSNRDVQLSWITENESKDNRYEIEISRNGQTFEKTGTLQASTSPNSSSTKYEYSYHADQAIGGQLYFRIRQTTTGGKVILSPVRSISFVEGKGKGFTVYPNPAVRMVSMQFDTPLNGDYSIELTNLMGQIVYKRLLRVNSSNSIDIELNNAIAAGVYNLRARSISTNAVYSSKLMIRR